MLNKKRFKLIYAQKKINHISFTLSSDFCFGLKEPRMKRSAIDERANIKFKMFTIITRRHCVSLKRWSFFSFLPSLQSTIASEFSAKKAMKKESGFLSVSFLVLALGEGGERRRK